MKEKKERSMRGSAKKNLILCVHAHQPVGNFDHVFDEAFEKCYRPFFQVLEKHPKIPVVCHFSGSLIDWLEKNKPKFIEMTRCLALRGQIEFLGGAYYEPIYGAIPSRDLLGQISKMGRKIEMLYGAVPRGVWLTERVWDPHLAGLLKKARVEYTIVDDYHLTKARVRPPVTGYYRAKANGAAVDLFASMKELRYLIPFKEPEDVTACVRGIKAAPEDVFVFADDLEKFGFWPGTWAWVYERGWLDRWFGLLEKDEGIQLSTFDRFRKDFKPKKTVRVPHASYSEMMEWSGGRFYNFFDKYSESRYMRDRMWSLSNRVEKGYLKNGLGESARDALYRAQCNCAYWHGVFGGLYLHHLRSAIFENLIEADRRLANSENHCGDIGSRPVRAVEEKFSSGKRWRLEQGGLISFFNPALGASLEEIDDRPRGVNLMCNLQRRRESYHRMLSADSSLGPGGAEAPLSIHHILGLKEKDLEQHLFYDRSRRLSFMDHFFADEISPDEFRASTYEEIGNFIEQPYKVDVSTANAVLSFWRKGRLEFEGKHEPLVLKKTVLPEGDSAIRVRYSLENKSRRPLEFVFGVEFNFSIGQEKDSPGISVRDIKERVFRDSWRNISIKLASQNGVGLLTAASETISESEGGLERTYQGLSVLLQRRFSILPGQAGEHELMLEVG